MPENGSEAPEATVQLAGLIFNYLAPVEAQYATAISELISSIGLAKVAARDEARAIQDAMKAMAECEASAHSSLRTIQSFGVPLSYNRPVGMTVPVLAARAYGISTQGLVTRIILPGSMSAAEAMARMKYISALRTLGTFFSNKAYLGILACSPVRIQINFSRGFKQLCRTLQMGAQHPMFQEALQQVRQFAEAYWTRIVSEGLTTLSFPAIGGSYAAPLKATGTLAASIGPLSGAKPVKRYKTSKNPDLQFVISVGPREGPDSAIARNPMLYGSALARTYPTRPPGRKFMRPGSPADQRLQAWAKSRGISEQALRFIKLKIARRGVYGREWMAVIVGGTPLSPVVGHAKSVFLRTLRRALKGEG